MRTPKKYMDNIKAGIITKEMLSDCLFSVNKRAKNCRDQERSYRRTNYQYYINYKTKKEEYYAQKEKLLSLLNPVCIHTEQQQYRERIYDYEIEFDSYSEDSENIINYGSYYDRDMREEVEFIDVIMTALRYYLFYDLGNHTFHSPIDEDEIESKYSYLEIKDVGHIQTKGEEIETLVSVQFVNKVLELIDSNKYELQI